MEATREHEAARINLRRLDPNQHSVTGVFRQLELNISFRFALDHGNTFPYSVLFYEIAHLKFDQ